MNVTELDADVDFLCGSTSATYSPTNKRRNMNIAYRDVARLIWESDGGWTYDDSNATDLPIATTTLVDAQRDYSMPTDAMRVRRLEVLDSAGNYIKLRPLDMNEVQTGMDEFLGGENGLPLFYELVGRSILLYPTPASGDVTLAAGLKIYTDRDVTDLAVTATTTEPGFASPFHRILSYAAAIDFSRDDKERQFLMVQKDRLEQGMIRFYSKAAAEIKTRMKPSGKKKWSQYT